MNAQLMSPRVDAWLRSLAALVGTLPAALFGSVALARFLPLSDDTRFAIGFSLVIPLWVTAMCLAFLATNGARAWRVCLGVTAFFVALVYGVPP